MIAQFDAYGFLRIAEKILITTGKIRRLNAGSQAAGSRVQIDYQRSSPMNMDWGDSPRRPDDY